MSSTEPGRPFQSLGSKLALGVVVLLVITAVIVAINSAVNGGAPAPAPTSSSPTEPSVDPEDESVCGLDGFERDSSLDAAPSAEWALVGTVIAPSSPTSGPGLVQGNGFRSCYAHTAEGALFAAANFIALGTDASLRDQLVELVAPGPGRDAVEGREGGSSSSSARAQVAGFQLGSYTADAVTVDLALNYSTGELVSVPLKLAWVQGDWKLVLSDDGSSPLSPAVLSNLGGYTVWGV